MAEAHVPRYMFLATARNIAFAYPLSNDLLLLAAEEGGRGRKAGAADGQFDDEPINLE